MERQGDAENLQRIEMLLKELNQRIQNVEEMQKIVLVNNLFDEIEGDNKNLESKDEMSDVPDKMQIIVQYDYKDYIVDDIRKAVVKKFKKIKPDEALEDLKIYVKPEDRTAYFVANGLEDKRYRVSLYQLRRHMTELG